MTDQQITLDILAETGDVTPRIDPEVLEEARLQRSHEASRRAANPPRLPESGHNLWVEVSSATIDGDEIHVSVVVTGKVQRPEALATAQRVVRTVKVPAEVERRVPPAPRGFEVGDPVEVLASSPKRETRGLLGEIARCESRAGEWVYEVVFGPEGRVEGASWVIAERDLRKLEPAELQTRRYRR
jgi:hypothetical protein